MKAKVLCREFPWYNMELPVVKMNYDKVLLQAEDERISFDLSQVEILPENNEDKLLINHRDLLKIKLNRGVKAVFYTTLLEAIKDELGVEMKELLLLKDEFRVARKGIWEKKLLMLVNAKTPLEAIIIGRNFGNTFDITILEPSAGEFLDLSSHNIKALESQLQDIEKLIGVYKKAAHSMLFNSVGTGEREGKLLQEG